MKIVKSDRLEADDMPPRPLGKHGLKLWRAVLSEWDISDVAGRELLALASQALDRAESCREQIDADGEVIRSKVGLREHPCLKHELQNRSFVSRTLSKLGLDAEPIRGVGRPTTRGYEG